MPSFFISFSVRISTLTPSVSSSFALCGEFDRAEHVGRLVDEIAGEDDAVGDGLGVGEGLLRAPAASAHWMVTFDGLSVGGLPSSSSFLVL